MRTLHRRGTRPVRAVVGGALLVLLVTACVPKAGTVPLESPPQPSGCITSVGPATELVVGGCGGDITYNVSVPARCLQFACGLILDVHGWTMNGDVQEANTTIAAIGREEGYIVVQPNAPGSPPSWSSAHYPLVAAFVELAIDVWGVDHRRVHVTGFSQGGAMTGWMRCNRTSLFASAAPAAMAGSACANGANMPTLYVQGTNDIYVSQAAIDATVASYVNGYGLDRQVVLEETADYRWVGYGSSDPETPAYQTFIHRYSSYGVNGHCIHGAPDPSNPYGCDQPSPHPHGRLIVDFFKANPKKA
jgi:poly(3-hydroxybutyrate) depolymerase